MVRACPFLFAVNAALVSGDTWQCGNYNTKMECNSFATGLCHSGSNPECSQQHGCGSDTYAAVSCSDDATDVDKGGSHWLWGSYGAHLSCADSTGNAATGACGGGSNPDCESGSYFGIDCSQNNVHVVAETCKWEYHGYGSYYTCPDDRPILAGSCSGGSNPDCNGYYFGTQCCAEHSTVNNVLGSWFKTTFSSSGPQTISVSAGTTTTHTKSETITTGTSVQAKVQAGLKVKILSASVSVGKTTSQSLAEMDSNSFSSEYQVSYETTIAPGRVWQWKYDADLNRGSSTTWSGSVVSTPNDESPPCCLPGQFKDPAEPTGPCVSGQLDLCGRSLAV